MNSEKITSEENSENKLIKRDVLVEQPWVVWALMFLFWTIFSTVLTIQDYFRFFADSKGWEGFTLLTLPLNSFTYFYTWFALTPMVFWFGQRFPFDRGEKSGRNFVIHVFLSLVTAGLYLLTTSIIMQLLIFEYSGLEKFYYGFSKRVYTVAHFQVLIYWALLGAGFAVDYYKKYRERETEAARLLIRSTKLEALLAIAQLDSLKMQLHPHFLFNTLHAVSALIEDSPKRARRVIARLGELLRSTLDIADQQTVPLEQEVALTKLYLEIEQERFGDRLEVDIDVSESDSDCMVPTLIFQPLIENAIKHGIKDAKKTAIIEIKAVSANKRILISVFDNGPGFPVSDTVELKDGIGLSNTKARLEQLYGKDHKFDASNSEGGGAVIKIDIPCKRSREIDAEK